MDRAVPFYWENCVHHRREEILCGPTGGLDYSEQEYLRISTVGPNLLLTYLILCDLAEQKR